MTTIADIDRDLDRTRLDYQRAVDDGRHEDANRHYLELDALLDQRCHTPHDK